MTIIIIIITAGISVAAFRNRELMSKFLFNAFLIKHSNQWYRAVSHAFIHSGWGHLAVNMWVLYVFGDKTEAFFAQSHGMSGSVMYLALYLGGILFSALPSYRKHQDDFNYNALGASGAVSAVLFASVYADPTMNL